MGKTDLDRARKITTSSNWTGSASNNKAKREGVSETKGFVVRRKTNGTRAVRPYRWQVFGR